MEKIAREMTNVKASVRSGKLTATMNIDVEAILGGELKLSESGKTYLLASTHGAQDISIPELEKYGIKPKYSINAYVSVKDMEQYKKLKELEAKGGRALKDMPTVAESAQSQEMAELKAMVAQQQAQMAQLMELLAKK